MSERGSVTPLIIGFTVMLLLLVGAVVDASAAFLARQRLDALADAAALAATEGVQGREVYDGGLGERAQINATAARARAAESLRSSGVAGLRFRVGTRTDSVTVHVQAPIDLPFRIGDIGGAVLISGSASSAVTVSD